MYIGNGSAFPGNKCGNKIVFTPFPKGELETLRRKPLETNMETFCLFRFQFLGPVYDLEVNWKGNSYLKRWGWA
jgi:hypothetical protein